MIKMLKRLGMLCFLLSGSVYAEEEASIKWVGAPSLAYGASSLFLNFGGPSFKMDYGVYSVGISFYPSLRYIVSGTGSGTFAPILGVGPYVSYSKFVLSLPVYSINSAMTPAVGIGYRF